MKEFFLQLFITIVAVLSPIHGMLMATGVLIFGDLFTGIWAAIKRKEEISSAAMRRTISKLFIYHTVLITAFFTETYMFQSFIPMVKIGASLIGIVELKSILENSNVILGYDLFKSLINHLGSKNDKGVK